MILAMPNIIIRGSAKPPYIWVADAAQNDHNSTTQQVLPDVLAQTCGFEWTEDLITESSDAYLQSLVSVPPISLPGNLPLIPLDALMLSKMRYSENEDFGYGVFARQQIQQGQIIVYSGQLKYHEEQTNSHYTIGNTLEQISDTTNPAAKPVVDALRYGNIARFIQDLPDNDEIDSKFSATAYFKLLSDSSRPATANLTHTFQALSIGSNTVYLPILKANRTIKVGELLGFSYSKFYWLALCFKRQLFNPNGSLWRGNARVNPMPLTWYQINDTNRSIERLELVPTFFKMYIVLKDYLELPTPSSFDKVAHTDTNATLLQIPLALLLAGFIANLIRSTCSESILRFSFDDMRNPIPPSYGRMETPWKTLLNTIMKSDKQSCMVIQHRLTVLHYTALTKVNRNAPLNIAHTYPPNLPNIDLIKQQCDATNTLNPTAVDLSFIYRAICIRLIQLEKFELSPLSHKASWAERYLTPTSQLSTPSKQQEVNLGNYYLALEEYAKTFGDHKQILAIRSELKELTQSMDASASYTWFPDFRL
tara:strand:+ start:3487 stop:5094 length:1608 start_codon:yes stop_codon:yes gene_type:complete